MQCFMVISLHIAAGGLPSIRVTNTVAAQPVTNDATAYVSGFAVGPSRIRSATIAAAIEHSRGAGIQPKVEQTPDCG
jgi:hypothetical protein